MNQILFFKLTCTLAPTVGFNGQSFISPTVEYTTAVYNMIDAGRKQDIGNHIVTITPTKFTRMMDRYVRMTADGAYYRTEKRELKLQSVQLDYFLVNSGTSSAPNWQAVGLFGESFTHIIGLANAGATGFSQAEELAITLQADEASKITNYTLPPLFLVFLFCFWFEKKAKKSVI